jgi:7,8-dihydropterin-6-yl-methyl-4-(beta-D-ribofuranosyl)aminobenzene 5'-phosphate synthase
MAIMVNKVKVTCLVSNSVLVDSKFQAEHALSILVEVGMTRILFDTGCTPAILQHNCNLLGVDISRIKYIVLSHGHLDHVGGLEWVLSQTRQPLIVSDAAIFSKKSLREGKEYKANGLAISRDKLQSMAQLQLSEAPYALVQGIYASGRIPRMVPFEVHQDKYLVENNLMLEIDNFNDERALFVEAEKGMVVITGCCHAGINNTLTQALKTYQKPILSVIGGLHLSDAPADKVNKTATFLREKFKPQSMHLTHCTGLETLIALRNALGVSIKDLPVGTVLDF